MRHCQRCCSFPPVMFFCPSRPVVYVFMCAEPGDTMATDLAQQLANFQVAHLRLPLKPASVGVRAEVMTRLKTSRTVDLAVDHPRKAELLGAAQRLLHDGARSGAHLLFFFSLFFYIRQ